MDRRLNQDNLQARSILICKFLGIRESSILTKDLKSEKELLDQIVLLLKEDHKLLSSSLYKIVDRRIRQALEKKGLTISNDHEEKVKQSLLSGETLQYLEIELKLIFPRPVLSKLNLTIQLILLLLPISIVSILSVLNIEFLGAIYGLIKLGWIATLIFLPNVIAYFLFPRLYRPELSGVLTYRDFISKVTFMNRYFYMDDDFKIAREELSEVIESIRT